MRSKCFMLERFYEPPINDDNTLWTVVAMMSASWSVLMPPVAVDAAFTTLA